MPNWIDDEGFNWFGILECKRCLKRFKMDEDGEIPAHNCLGKIFKSITHDGIYNDPVEVKSDR